MDLKDFVKKTITTPEEAKNFLSFLIGFNFSGKDKTEAIIGVYESYPKEHQEKENLFAPIFFKLFVKYGVLKEQEHYYKKFFPLWSVSERESIQQSNKHIILKEVNLYVNSLAFVKALSTYKNNEDFLSFLDNKEDTIIILLKKDKKKFSQNMSKHNSWNNFINYDYFKFKDFCKKYDFNSLDILKEEVIDAFSGLKYIAQKTTDSQLHEILQDTFNNKACFNDSDFLNPKSKRDYPNIFHIALISLTTKKKESFNFIFNNYSNLLQECLGSYINNNIWKDSEIKIPDIKNFDYWVKAIDEMIINTKKTYHNEPFNDFYIHELKKNLNIQLFNSIILDNELSKKEETKTKKIKI